ncbi:VanZ family protein [Rhodohalobacter sp. 614A]|uniref:VanZ family protein n=1 Tax=Rhodohalobacter sp. 614A TaxID=2908649 RepID=UPI001F34C71D|nr:VanZ family protein [Rhodohalobacter sp. 614A]
MKIISPALTIFFYILVILILYLLPTGSVNLNKPVIASFRLDSLLHMLLFLPWMYFNSQFRRHQGKLIRTRSIIIWLFSGILLASGIEWIHLLVSYRIFNFKDMFYNIAGLLLGMALVPVVNKIRGMSAASLKND